MKPARPKLYPMPDLVETLIEGDDGRLLIDLRSGIKQLVQEKSEVFPLPGAGRESRPLRMLRDRDGNLWIGTVGRCLLIVHRGVWLGYFKGGVAHFKDGQVRTSYAGLDGLGQRRINGLRLDRHNTLWVATEGGFSRVHNGRIATLTSKNGLPCDTLSGGWKTTTIRCGCTWPAAWSALSSRVGSVGD